MVSPKREVNGYSPYKVVYFRYLSTTEPAPVSHRRGMSLSHIPFIGVRRRNTEGVISPFRTGGRITEAIPDEIPEKRKNKPSGPAFARPASKSAKLQLIMDTLERGAMSLFGPHSLHSQNDDTR